uniref:Uncharacterized protein n=1 Tax=Anguilla anguilla TaxID=7936 RepID=A0A0E9RXM3_ANGAN
MIIFFSELVVLKYYKDNYHPVLYRLYNIWNLLMEYAFTIYLGGKGLCDLSHVLIVR